MFAENAITHAVNNLVLTNVPVIILDVTDPRDPENVVPGIIGTNMVAGRNMVLDPKPGGSPGPGLFISDPITTEKNWTSAAASGTFGTGSNWNGGTAPILSTVASPMCDTFQGQIKRPSLPRMRQCGKSTFPAPRVRR